MFYTVNDKEYSSDSTPNQKILDQLINREVFCNMNQEMDFILSALAYDASIPEDPPFDESDYESAICDASSQTCSECGNSSYFDEVGVTDLDDSKFQNPNYDSDVPEPEDPYICPVCGFTYPTLAQARACCESETVHVSSVAVLSTATMNTMTSTPPRPKSLNGGQSPTGSVKSSKPAVKSFLIAGASPTGAVRLPVSPSLLILLSLLSPRKCKSWMANSIPGHPNPSPINEVIFL